MAWTIDAALEDEVCDGDSNSSSWLIHSQTQERNLAYTRLYHFVVLASSTYCWAVSHKY